MNFSKISLIVILLISLTSSKSLGYSCIKYIVDFGSRHEALNGELSIGWSINQDCFDLSDTSKHGYQIDILNLYDEVIFHSESSTNYFNFSTSELQGDNEIIIFRISESDNENRSEIGIRINNNSDLSSSDWVDSLNYYLTSGYIPNALYTLRSHGKEEIIPQLIKASERLSKVYYDYPPNGVTSFDCYYDKDAGELARMPKIKGINKFENSLNDQLSDLIWLEIKVDNQNQILNYHTMPNKYENKLDQHIQYLEFKLKVDGPSNAYLVIKKLDKNHKYEVSNKKYLKRTDPNFFDHIGHFFQDFGRPIY